MAVESGYLPAFITIMKTAGLQPVVLDTFAWYYEKVLTGDKGFIFNKDIRPVESHEIISRIEIFLIYMDEQDIHD